MSHPIHSPTLDYLSSPGIGQGPSRIGEYEILEEIGRGGMGTVYRAYHIHLKTIFAIKVLSSQRIGDESAIRRFFNEIAAIGRLQHPHIVRATDARVVNGIHFLVMEFVDGVDLSQLASPTNPINFRDACELIRQVAVALSVLDQHGLVHRDVKPSNVLLGIDGVAKLADLGLAKLRGAQGETATGDVFGTVDYIAPEQAEGCKSVDTRADIYSLGCTFYELLTGKPPFAGDNYDSMWKKLQAHREEGFPRIPAELNVPVEVCEVVYRMTQKQPEDRFPSPRELIDALPGEKTLDFPSLCSEAHQKRGVVGDIELRLRGSSRSVVDPVIETVRAPQRNPRPRSRGAWKGLALFATILLAAGIAWGVFGKTSASSLDQSEQAPRSLDMQSTDESKWSPLLTGRSEDPFTLPSHKATYLHDAHRARVAFRQRGNWRLLSFGKPGTESLKVRFLLKVADWQGQGCFFWNFVEDDGPRSQFRCHWIAIGCVYLDDENVFEQQRLSIKIGEPEFHQIPSDYRMRRSNNKSSGEAEKTRDGSVSVEISLRQGQVEYVKCNGETVQFSKDPELKTGIADLRFGFGGIGKSVVIENAEILKL